MFMKIKKGFAIVEILVVLAVVAILVSIVLVSMGSAREKMRDAQRMADLKKVSSVQQKYYDVSKKFFTAVSQNNIPEMEAYFPLTVDPKNNEPLVYKWVDNTADNQKFCLYAHMENPGSCSDVRYFVATNIGYREVCGSFNFSIPLTLDNCVNFSGFK